MPDWKHHIRKQLAGLNLEPTREAEIVEELSQHLEDRWVELRSGGASEEQARTAVLDECTHGDLLAEQLKRVEHSMTAEPVIPGTRNRNFWGSLWQDLHYAVRTLRKNPGFTAVAVLTLALGIGATTAMFSAVYGVLLRPLPYPKPDQIVRLWEVDSRGHRMNLADPNFEDLRAQNESLQGLAEYAWWPDSVTGGFLPTRTLVARVSHDFFAVMRTEPLLGRGFRPDDQVFGAAPVALVSYGYWKQFLGGVADLSQTKLRIEDHSFSVVGVLPLVSVSREMTSGFRGSWRSGCPAALRTTCTLSPA
jgi:hypothetical protein